MKDEGEKDISAKRKREKKEVKKWKKNIERKTWYTFKNSINQKSKSDVKQLK